MSANAGAGAPIPTGDSTVDAKNPWLGLASFTEETREFFYGREDEVAELARRVQRKLLTVLFGQSGLGKTSILRAGLVPRLRGQGYCPIYVRIDYARAAPEPAEQIKQAILRATRRSGAWTQTGVAVAGETLWEFLHHRDDVLRDESGATLIPLLIFDQFEEIFTLAQTDDFGRARAARFIADLADLVENRPPKEFEARLEHDDAAAERFDFARSDYRVLISLREDYLAPLEGLKGSMPSVTQNRLRLAPMTGQQALAAVLRPGQGLVSQEVAEAIVRFVAGGAELANAEVEPSLLSLICRELNDTRLAEGRAEISLDLLAGSHETILSNFYERSLADQPPAVRRVIEDELLTESGFRENVAEERMLSLFAAAGAVPATLATLVNRRLLRIEERLDVRRVEITHDVLCGVVKQSRDLRHEREARDATERMLAEQSGRARAARHALVRARQVAAACIVLALGACVAAGFAYVSTQRAHEAEREAQAARAAADETTILTEQARGQAEQLLGYLTEDFSGELEGVGRLDLVAELAKRQVDYFKALPPALKVGDTARNGAFAMAYYGKAAAGLGKLDEADKVASNAIDLFEQLRQSGDRSESTTVGLGLATLVRATVLEARQDPGAAPVLEQAAAVLKPVAETTGASLAAARTYVRALERLGLIQSASNQLDASLATLELAMRIADHAGAHDVRNSDLAAAYVICAAWRIQTLGQLGRRDEGRRVGGEAASVADRLLSARPSYLPGLRGQQLLSNSLAYTAMDGLHQAEGLASAKRAERASLELTRLDPGNRLAANNLGADRVALADASWRLGRPRDAVTFMRASFDAFRAASSGGTFFVLNALNNRAALVTRQLELGDTAAAADQFAAARRELDLIHRIEPATSPIPIFGECLAIYIEATGAAARDDWSATRRLGRECLERSRKVVSRGPIDTNWKYGVEFGNGIVVGQAEYALGNFDAAEQALRAALDARSHWPVNSNFDRREQAEPLTWLAMAVARRGDLAEAARVVAPVVRLHRELAAQNHDDEWQHVELAASLYAEALADPARRTVLLAEAAQLIAILPAQMRELLSVRRWQNRISAAQKAAHG